ncbi:cytochrome P450, partial [Zychaea mexicana]|uniref:cytochrome P450 n=1 Tax=Zychaea mexicana TaxID=64656 RepID=UPI0022FECBE4
YLAADKLLKPPKQLRHIPYASPIKSLFAVIRDASADEVRRAIAYPLTTKTENGLYSRFDPTGWTVIINDPVIAKQYLFRSTTFIQSPLSDQFAGTLISRFILGPNILFLSGQHWRDQRKIANPTFHRSMPLALFGRLTEKMFNVIDATEGAIDVYDLMERWTLDAIGNAGLGFDFDAISSTHNIWIRRYNHVVKASQNPFHGLFPVLEQRFLNWIPSRKRAHDVMSVLTEMIQSIIDQKRKLIDEQKARGIAVLEDPERDLLTMMIEGGQQEGQGLTDEELLICEFNSNVFVFFFAGHDTTASALSSAISRNEAIKVLGNEYRNVVPTVEQSQKMRYIEQVIKETLRMYAPVDFLVPRRAVKDTELGGVFIPKGTQITFSTYQLHRNPKVWGENPDLFDPERFAPKKEADYKQNFNWLPFSTGSRQCIGMNLKLAEQRLLLPMLLRKYEWHLPKDTIHTPENIFTKES